MPLSIALAIGLYNSLDYSPSCDMHKTSQSLQVTLSHPPSEEEDSGVGLWEKREVLYISSMQQLTCHVISASDELLVLFLSIS